MSQAKIINNTAFEYQALFATDEKGNPIVTPVIKGTFAINLDGTLEFLQQQRSFMLTLQHPAICTNRNVHL